MKKMSNISRILIAVASLVLISTYFLPIWFIYLTAPQYPEGLTMKIWLQNFSGDVAIINGLNHYIGMKHITIEMFPEFSYLIYIVAFLILAGIATAVFGKRKWLTVYCALLLLTGISAMYDFYRWGYDYGHNLDPKAPIQVPGFSYQPPVIGHKSLLNFDAYSYPDAGGWVVAVVGIIMFIILLLEWRRSRMQKSRGGKKSLLITKHTAVAASLIVLMCSSCTVKPESFVYGKDNCSFCKMTIIAPSFGGEVVTKKGKVYKFDDLHCMISFLKSGEVSENSIVQLLVINGKGDGRFIDARQAVYLQSEQLHSPMNGNAIAYEDQTDASAANQQLKGLVCSWKNLCQQMK